MGLNLDSVDYTTACLTIRKMFQEKELIHIINEEDATLYLKVGALLEIPKEKDTIIIERIYFEIERKDITAKSKLALIRILNVLNKNVSVSVTITGHTDSNGAEGYNLKLSQKRSNQIKEYLISQGVSSSRLTSKGYGESRLTNHCKDGVACSEKEHAQNRRTEFEITWE